MMRASFTVLLVAIVACGSSTDTGNAALTAADVSGTWDLHVNVCAAGTLPLRLSASATGALTSAVNAWSNVEPANFSNRPLDGSVDLSTGAVELHLYASGAKTSAMIFVGTITTDHALSGTLTDPMTGYAPIFHLSGSPGCSSPATGSRVSP